MGMMSGYRQTEAGVLPNDWNVLQLISCCSKVTDGTHDTPKPVRTGVPFLTAIHIKDNWIDYESCLYVTKEDHSIIFSRCNPEKNDVLMVNIGAGVATTALVNVDYEFSLKNVALLKPDSRRVEGTYLNYALAHRKQAIIQDLSSGGAQPFLSLRQIGGILIPLPPTKAEQESIAEALRDVDAVVECLEQLLIKKRNIKHGAVQELLTGKKRLRGFGGEWTLKQLGEVGGISGSGVDKKLRSDELPVRLVNYMDAYRRDFIYGSDLDHWVTAPVHKIRRCAVQKGDVFFTPSSETRDDIANSAVAMEDIPDAVYSYHLVRLRLKEGWNLKFSAYAFKTRDFLDQAETLCDGSGTRYVISLGKFRSIQIKFPSFQEQEAIGSLLYDMDAEIAVLEAKLAKARQIKQGMMQELLTGRIRLVRPSASVVPFAVKQQADVNPSKSHNP